MAKIAFSEQAWQEYLYWQLQDKKTLKRVNQLLKDIERNHFEGLGKPDALKDYENIKKIPVRLDWDFLQILVRIKLLRRVPEPS